MLRLPDEVTWSFLFFLPAAESEDWVRGELWDRAGAFSGAQLLCDPAGTLAGQIGAAVSGSVLAYGSNGQLMYSGGVTGGRGHVGDSRGAQGLLQALQGGLSHRYSGLAFGCPLSEDQ